MKQVNLNNLLKKIEVRYINKALVHTKGNVTQSAKLVGIGRTTLIERLKALRKDDSVKLVTSFQVIDTTLFTPEMLDVYYIYRNMDKSTKIAVLMPINERSIDQITELNLDKRFMFLITGEHKNMFINAMLRQRK